MALAVIAVHLVLVAIKDRKAHQAIPGTEVKVVIVVTLVQVFLVTLVIVAQVSLGILVTLVRASQVIQAIVGSEPLATLVIPAIKAYLVLAALAGIVVCPALAATKV